MTPSELTQTLAEKLFQEGDKCPKCEGRMHYGDVENCSCHINPPCSACVNNPLTCAACGWEWDAPKSLVVPTDIPGISQVIYPALRAIHVFPHGGRIMDYDYDSRSGSTMVWSGRFEGPVTAEDIVARFGSGTFGHEGPFLHNGKFVFTKITD